jgi:hypothetical protein
MLAPIGLAARRQGARRLQTASDRAADPPWGFGQRPPSPMPMSADCRSGFRWPGSGSSAAGRTPRARDRRRPAVAHPALTRCAIGPRPPHDHLCSTQARHDHAVVVLRHATTPKIKKSGCRTRRSSAEHRARRSGACLARSLPRSASGPGTVGGLLPECYGPGPDMNLTPSRVAEVYQNTELVKRQAFRSDHDHQHYEFALAPGSYDITPLSARSSTTRPFGGSGAHHLKRAKVAPLVEALACGTAGSSRSSTSNGEPAD